MPYKTFTEISLPVCAGGFLSPEARKTKRWIVGTQVSDAVVLDSCVDVSTGISAIESVWHLKSVLRPDKKASTPHSRK